MNKVKIIYTAKTPEERTKGLTLLPNQLGKDEGMLFIFDEPSDPAFWNRGVNYPIDVAFFDNERKLISISHLAANQEASVSCLTDHPKYVIETNYGWFQRNNISQPGTWLRDIIEMDHQDFKQNVAQEVTKQAGWLGNLMAARRETKVLANEYKNIVNKMPGIRNEISKGDFILQGKMKNAQEAAKRGKEVIEEAHNKALNKLNPSSVDKFWKQPKNIALAGAGVLGVGYLASRNRSDENMGMMTMPPQPEYYQ